MIPLMNDDNDSLGKQKKLLSPAEKRTLEWIKSDPARAFCSRDIAETIKITEGTARNIISKLNKLKLIELFCRDKLAFYKLVSSDPSKIKKPIIVSHMRGTGLRRAQINLAALLSSLPCS
jgi:hypothetical protein